MWRVNQPTDEPIWNSFVFDIDVPSGRQSQLVGYSPNGDDFIMYITIVSATETS